MSVLTAPELIQSIDTYEEVLKSFPQIVPEANFTVYQDEIDLMEINSFPTLSPAAEILRGRVTLRRLLKKDAKIDYFVALVIVSEELALPRVSSTNFERDKNTLATTSYTYNAQYGKTECKNAAQLETLHVGLANLALNSDNARQRIETTYNALLDLEEKSKDQKISEFKRKEIEKSIGYCKLK
jgi:hypothetical protein